jgi:hypothetical protein
MLLISKVKENINSLETETGEIEIEDLIERLLILDKLERSNQQSLKGEVVGHSEFKKEVLEWFK